MQSNKNFMLYGLGSVAFGIKNNAFGWFLLFYYNIVLGLPGWMASLAIAIALIIDAVSDLLIGYASDHTHSNFGRRHPYMYAALLPVPLSFYLLWNPPSFSEDINLFIYLLVMTIFVRTSTTLFEIPNQSLGPEITRGYDERTKLMSIRYFFGWMGGNAMSLLNYFVFLTPTIAYPDGQLNPAGHQMYGVVGAWLIFGSMLLSSAGLHKIIPDLEEPVKNENFDDIKKELRHTLLNTSFVVLFIGGIFSGMAAGFSAALNIYFNTYFWGFSSTQIGIAGVVGVIPGILGAVALSTYLSKRIGKRRGAIYSSLTAIFFVPFPYLLRIYGYMPEFGSYDLLWIMCGYFFLEVMTAVASTILVSSMIADIVEDSELATKRRSEGLFFATVGFSGKAISGVGIFLAGLVTSIAGLPEGAKPSELDDNILVNVVFLFLPIYILFYLISVYFFSLYKINRDKHESNLEAIKQRNN